MDRETARVSSPRRPASADSHGTEEVLLSERDALAAGFSEVTYEETRWAYQIDADQVKALYANFSSIQRLTPRARETLLDDLARIAREQFDGQVTRNMTTCLYQLR